MAEVLRVYGTPLKTAKAARDEDLSADRVLYELPSAWKIAYRRQGVLFRFDKDKRVRQFVVFRPETPEPAK